MSKIIRYVLWGLGLVGCASVPVPQVQVDSIPNHHGVFLQQALKDHLNRQSLVQKHYILRVKNVSFSKVPVALQRDGNTGLQHIRVALNYTLFNDQGDAVYHQTLHLSHADTSSMARQNFIIDEDPVLWQRCAQALVADIALFHKTQTQNSDPKRQP